MGLVLLERRKPPHLIHYLSNMSSVRLVFKDVSNTRVYFQRTLSFGLFFKAENKGKDELPFLFLFSLRAASVFFLMIRAWPGSASVYF